MEVLLYTIESLSQAFFASVCSFVKWVDGQLSTFLMMLSWGFMDRKCIFGTNMKC